jgi:hypothetical protein
LIEAEQVLIGNAPDEPRRGRIGGIALRIDRRRVGRRIARRSVAMRVVPEQQHLVKGRGNILEHAAEGCDEETVPIIRIIGRFMRGRWRRSTIGWSRPG